MIRALRPHDGTDIFPASINRLVCHHATTRSNFSQCSSAVPQSVLKAQLIFLCPAYPRQISRHQLRRRSEITLQSIIKLHTLSTFFRSVRCTGYVAFFPFPSTKLGTLFFIMLTIRPRQHDTERVQLLSPPSSCRPEQVLGLQK